MTYDTLVIDELYLLFNLVQPSMLGDILCDAYMLPLCYNPYPDTM